MGEGEGLGYYVGNGYLPGLVVGRFELYFDFNLKHTNRSFCRCLMPDEQLRRRRRLRTVEQSVCACAAAHLALQHGLQRSSLPSSTLFLLCCSAAYLAQEQPLH